MILIFAGTQDGRQLAELLSEKGYSTIVSVVSDYGAELVHGDNIRVIQGKMQATDMQDIINKVRITLIIDASHPFARNVSENAIHACKETGIRYLRYERPIETCIGYDHLIKVENIHDAIGKLNEIEGKVFLTTGSNSLDILLKNINDPNRLIARVLPGTEIMSKCMSLGLRPNQVIAMQGPFSRELNREMFKHFNSSSILTKDSGSIGGIENKIEAAQDLKIPVIIITRPQIEYPLVVSTFEQILERVESWEI